MTDSESACIMEDEISRGNRGTEEESMARLWAKIIEKHRISCQATAECAPQEVEEERQQMLARLRTELREQVGAIHADVTLPPDREQGSEATEQKLHILLYQTDVPEAELSAALSDLRTQRRREKAQYQGAPFADVFQVELILSEEDSDRACIVDVGDTGMSYVIPWSSIPQELQQPLRRYVAQADGKLCGYCKEDLCNTENGRMIVELYLGKQEHHVSRILY